MAGAPNANYPLEFLFSKTLTSSDITRRLAWPTEHVDALIEGVGRPAINLNAMPGHNVQFQLSDENGQSWALRCFTRQTGPYLKPVISAGWVELVRAKNLRVGDQVFFYRNRDPASQAPFVVHFVRAT